MEINTETNTKPQVERSEHAGSKMAQEPIFNHKKKNKRTFLSCRILIPFEGSRLRLAVSQLEQ